jgi:hypothetical protein
MRSRTWILSTLLLTLGVLSAVVILDVRLDVYGLFRDARGRRLPIYDTERRAKYLLSLHYVPQNFDAILIGSSLSANWDTSGISLFRIYNESTLGSNITEEKLLAEQVLRSPGLAAAICVLHPFLTDSHGLNTQEMTERERWGALGSTSLFRSYERMVLTALGRARPAWDDHGSQELNAPDTLNPVLTRIYAPGAEIAIDAPAFEEYRALVAELRRSGVKLVVVVPPTQEALLQPKREALGRYLDRMRTLFSPEDVEVDFDAPAYEPFRVDRSNFTDGVHLTTRGAVEAVRLLDERMQAERARLAR